MTAASEHGLGRAESGFSVESMLAEFRALRASVIRLWRRTQKQAGPDELEEMTRFNEAIDQATAESMARYVREVEAARGRVFAVLGHDLRTPLGVIVTSTHFLLETTKLTDEQQKLIEGMERSGSRMIELVRDLLDVALTRLGSGLPLERATMDMHEVIRDAVAEATGSKPGTRIEVETHGDLDGDWDGTRIAQALSNLIGNAMHHGAQDTPINVVANGDDAEQVSVSVTNQGAPIPPGQISGLFAAMKRGTEMGTGRADQEHLGLGLYIVDKIVEAHGGSIDVRSSETDGTTFTLSLPRHGTAPKAAS